jgi:hypothetical protein
MTREQEIIEQGAVKLNVDKRVYKTVAQYPLKFLKRKIESDEDWNPIRIRYFAIFGLTKAAKTKLNLQ